MKSQQFALMTSRGSDEWYTPPHIVDRARAAMGDIDLDPASCAVPQRWIRATAYYTKDQDGLAQPWGGRIWLNPPFKQTQAWVRKLEIEYRAGRVSQAVLLVNTAAGYNWWEELVDRWGCLMLRKRLTFITQDGTPGPDHAKKGQSLFYLGRHLDRFVGAYADLGRFVPSQKEGNNEP